GWRMALETGDMPRSTKTWRSSVPQERQRCAGPAWTSAAVSDASSASAMKILVDVLEGEGLGVASGVVAAGPVNGAVDPVGEAPAGLPPEARAGPGAVDLEQPRLIRGDAVGLLPVRARAPARDDLIDHRCNRLGVAGLRPEVEGHVLRQVLIFGKRL